MVMDEIRSFEKAHLFDLGHPLLNRIADSFVKAAGVSFHFIYLRFPVVYACYICSDIA